MTKFVLVGGYAGKTINLGGHVFVDGVFDYSTYSDGEGRTITPGRDEVELKGDYLAKNYQAFPEGSRELEEAQARIEKGERVDTDTLDINEREEREQTDRGRKGVIRTALTKLDAKNVDHWTDKGLPSVEAVRELSGDDKVSRKEIEELAPKLTREEAAKVAADPLDS